MEAIARYPLRPLPGPEADGRAAHGEAAIKFTYEMTEPGVPYPLRATS